jgi:hypothetical protein
MPVSIVPLWQAMHRLSGTAVTAPGNFGSVVKWL